MLELPSPVLILEILHWCTEGVSSGVEADVLVFDIVVSKFELELFYYINVLNILPKRNY